MITIYGYDKKEWDDMYILYRQNNGSEPLNANDVRRYWLKNKPTTPEGCVDVASTLAEGRRRLSTEEWKKMFDAFFETISKAGKL